MIGKTLSSTSTGRALPASGQTVTNSEHDHFVVISEPVEYSEPPLDHNESDESDNKAQHRTEPDHQRRQQESKPITGNPFDWILNNRSPIFATTLRSVRDRNLPQRLVDLVGTLEQRSGEADCIKMLLCKSTPIVWGMQQSIGERIDGVGDGDSDETESKQRLDGFFRYLPELKEFSEYGSTCEHRYKGCELTGE